METIPLSDVENLKRQGYEIYNQGDAGKANCDHFLILVRDRAAVATPEVTHRDVAILCSSFLRGPVFISDVRGALGH